MRKNAQNSETDLTIKIIAMISFIYFNKSRVKRAMIQRMTKFIIIVTRKYILQKTVLSLNKITFKLTL